MKIYASEQGKNYSYYTVYVSNRHNYGHTSSPKFGTEGECWGWIKNHIFERGVDVEIREVSSTVIPYTKYERYDPTSYNIPNSSFGDGAYISRSLWEDGCVSKDTLRKYAKEEI